MGLDTGLPGGTVLFSGTCCDLGGHGQLAAKSLLCASFTVANAPFFLKKKKKLAKLNATHLLYLVTLN